MPKYRKVANFLYFRLFTGDPTNYRNRFDRENMKTLPSKVGYFSKIEGIITALASQMSRIVKFISVLSINFI